MKIKLRKNPEEDLKGFPDDLEPWEDPLPKDPEFERLLIFFIKNRRRLAWQYGADRIEVTPEGFELYEEISRPKKRNKKILS